MVMIFTIMSIYSSFPIYAKAVQENSEQVNIVYFYVNICENCKEADEIIQNYIKSIENDEMNIEFKSHNIGAYNGLKYELYLDYTTAYNIDIQHTKIPILFVGDQYFEGKDQIEEALTLLAKDIKKGILPRLTKVEKSTNNTADALKEINAIKIMGIGLINGLNPCSLSMILILLSLFLVKTKKIFSIGLPFIFGKFITFILLGTILFQTLNVINSTKYLMFIKIAISIFVIILATLNIFDYFVAKKEKYGMIKNQLPSKLKNMNYLIIKKFSRINNKKILIVAMFFLGAIISVGEFLCTGQIYVLTITYMIRLGNGLSLLAFGYLCIYSLGFITPLTIILLILSKTQDVFFMSEWIRERLPFIKLMTAITLIVLGVVTVLNT